MNTETMTHYVNKVCCIARELRDEDATMTYGELAIKLGLWQGTEGKQGWSAIRFAVWRILNTACFLSQHLGDDIALAINTRFVRSDTGKPGKGAAQWNKMVA